MKPGDHVDHRHPRRLRLLRAVQQRAPHVVSPDARERQRDLHPRRQGREQLRRWRRCSPTAPSSATCRSCRSPTTSRSRRRRSSAAASSPAWARCSTGPTCSSAQTAAVFGVGGVGLNVIQALKVKGRAASSPSTSSPTRKALAKQFGATDFLDGSRDDIVDAIVALEPFSDERPAGRSTPAVSTGRSTASRSRRSRTTRSSASTGAARCVVIGVSGMTTEFHGLYQRLTQVDRGIIGMPGRHHLAAARHPADHRPLPPRRDPPRRARVGHVPDGRVREGDPRDGERHDRARRPHVLVTSYAARRARPRTPAARGRCPGNIDTEGKSLWELVEARAARTPDKVMAVDEQDRTWTYEEFRGVVRARRRRARGARRR